MFKLDPYAGKGAKPAPYRRRDYFKITLVNGNGKFLYADKEIEVQKQALVFSNPQIPYSWEQRDRIIGGCFCIFNQDFFHHYGNLNHYTLFQPDGNHAFELTDEQLTLVTKTFDRMFEEINSDYEHKYDLLRTIVYELVHFALKINPSKQVEKHQLNAAQRISTLFLELLERQFPIDNAHQILLLRSASDFAQKLNIHVNHLNRSIKEASDKTTSQLIAERILQEAKILLKQTA
ncbi:MAG: AraC family transcriptional regulator [Flavobacterium sp.]